MSLTTSIQRVRQIEADLAIFAPLPRRLTDDEATLFAEALAAGAVIVPRKVREYLSGVTCCPWQFEGCYVPVEDYGNGWLEQSAARATAKRDAFYARIQSGDLKTLIEEINGAAATRKAA